MTRPETIVEMQNIGIKRKRRHFSSVLTPKRYAAASRTETFWVFKGVNLAIRRGEHVGFLGMNGAGKSTILRVILGTLPPHEGTVKKRGLAIGLLDIASIFDLRMTGMENIRLFSLLYRFKDKGLDSFVEEVVEFSELGSVIDVPVADFSNGMFLRLAFSLAIASRPDILLLDEVSVVGDMPFQRKAAARLHKMRQEGLTAISASHAVAVLQQECDRLCVIHGGSLAFDGQPKDAVSYFFANVKRPSFQADTKDGSDGITGSPNASVDSEGTMGDNRETVKATPELPGKIKQVWSPGPGLLGVEWEVGVVCPEPLYYVAAVQKAGHGSITWGPEESRLAVVGDGGSKLQQMDVGKFGAGWYSVAVFACHGGSPNSETQPLGTWSEWQYVQ